MKFDRFDCLIREKYEPEFHPGNIGDSCHETGKYVVLSHDTSKAKLQFNFLSEGGGFLRHPMLYRKVDWGGPDKFSGDQFAPLILSEYLAQGDLKRLGITGREWFIPGTKTLMTPAAWAMVRGHWRLVNLFNCAQGMILKFPWRYNDQKKKLERTSGSSVDFLNMIVIWYFLKTEGHWATMVTSKKKLTWAVLEYYKLGSDPEPNVDWLVAIWLKALELLPE